MGYQRAGFEVVGIDIEEQPRYPFEFIQRDVLSLDPNELIGFDVIHASPPCQAYSVTRNRRREREYPELIKSTRELLRRTGKPYVIENVVGAPLRPARRTQ